VETGLSQPGKENPTAAANIHDRVVATERIEDLNGKEVIPDFLGISARTQAALRVSSLGVAQLERGVQNP
jgi:hypothetical protein